MKRIAKVVSASLVAGSLLAANPASAQTDEDLDPAAVAAAVRYGLPLVFEGYMTRCFETLSPDGFAISNAPRLREKFSDGADASWPGARQLMVEMANEESDDGDDLLESMDDDALRPFVDGLIEVLAAAEIEPESCETIERALEILDPLPADNIAAFSGFLVELFLADDADADAAFDLPPQVMTESRRRKLREQEEGL